MVNKAVVGIDPGGKGCLVLIDENYQYRAWEFRNLDHNRIISIMKALDAGYRIIGGFLEGVNDRPGEGSSSTFTFGRNFQFGVDLFDFNDIPYELVYPIAWQTEFSVYGLAAKFEREGLTKSQAKTKAKKENRRVAQAEFPGVDMTVDKADATLITTYGWRKTFGGLTHGKDYTRVLRPGTGVVDIQPSKG